MSTIIIKLNKIILVRPEKSNKAEQTQICGRIAALREVERIKVKNSQIEPQ